MPRPHAPPRQELALVTSLDPLVLQLADEYEIDACEVSRHCLRDRVEDRRSDISIIRPNVLDTDISVAFIYKRNHYPNPGLMRALIFARNHKKTIIEIEIERCSRAAVDDVSERAVQGIFEHLPPDTRKLNVIVGPRFPRLLLRVILILFFNECAPARCRKDITTLCWE